MPKIIVAHCSLCSSDNLEKVYTIQEDNPIWTGVKCHNCHKTISPHALSLRERQPEQEVTNNG